MITAAQLRAARALLGIDQRRLAKLSRLSVPTIQRMEASETLVRGNVDSLVKLIAAFDAAGVEMIDEGAGRQPGAHMISAVAISPVALQMSCVAGLLVTAVLAIVLSHSKSATAVVYSAASVICAIALWGSLRFLLGAADVTGVVLPVGLPWLGAHFRLDALASFFLVVVNLGGA